MNHSRIFTLKAFIIITLFLISFIFLFGGYAHTQWFPTPIICYLFPELCSPYYPIDGYFNSINGYLLGYFPFTPFFNPDISAAYNLAGIPTYPYFGSPYQTTFPYQTLPNSKIPYAQFDYPAYLYGTPQFYLNWVLLQ